MCKFNPKNQGRRLDPCMENLVKTLNDARVNTLACCCGHGKYPMTLVINIGLSDMGLSNIIPLEIFSDTQLQRKKRFYRRDKQGYYFIPEVIEKHES